MNKGIKIIFAILIFSLIFIFFAACGDENKSPENEDPVFDPDNAESQNEESAPQLKSSLPEDLDFGGTVINIYYFGHEDTVNYDALGEAGGDIVLDAVYQRNRKTEELLNVKFNWIEGSSDWDTFPGQVKKAMQAASEDYDLIIEENSRAFQQTLQGYFIDLKNADYIDLGQPWWYAKMMEEGSIDNNKRYFITGAMNMTTMFGASAVFFNKDIYKNHFGNTDEIYSHVLGGTWTHDVFAEYCRGVYTDLNGNQTADAGDLFGFEYEQWGVPNHLSMSTGLTYSSRDKDGLPVLDIYSEQSILWGETLYKLLYTDNISFQGDKKVSFLEGKNLFYVGTFGSANTLRAASFEYGILPHPKLSEGLDYMSGAATVNGTAAAVPVFAPSEKLGAVCAALESLCFEAYKNVVPVWYETALKIKYLDTEIDASIVDIIYDRITAPFIMMADKEMGIGSIFTNAVYGAKSSGSFTSYYEKNEGSLTKKWDKMIETYLSLEN